MSKIQGYLCDCCGNVFTAKSVKGIGHTPDIFKPLNSFYDTAPAVANKHYCMACFTERVSNPAGLQELHYRADRDEVTKELSHVFRKAVFEGKIK